MICCENSVLPTYISRNQAPFSRKWDGPYVVLAPVLDVLRSNVVWSLNQNSGVVPSASAGISATSAVMVRLPFMISETNGSGLLLAHAKRLQELLFEDLSAELMKSCTAAMGRNLLCLAAVPYGA